MPHIPVVQAESSTASSKKASNAVVKPWRPPPRPVRALVEPIPPRLAKLVEQTGAIRPNKRYGGTAYASTALYDVLSSQQKRYLSRSTSRHEASAGPAGLVDEAVYVAVAWQPEHRLLGKGKEKEVNLVIHIEKTPDELAMSSATSGPVLFVDALLLPRFAAPPIPALIQTIAPIPLSTVILQPVISSVGDSSPDIDLQGLLADLSDTSPDHGVNGLSNSHEVRRARVVRQGDVIALPRGGSVRVLMLEPVLQGICTRETQLLLTTTPHVLDEASEDHIDGYGFGAEDDARSVHSISKTHLSMDDFDPDAFLSSSLSLAIHRATPDRERDDYNDGLAESYDSLANGSGTSGSTTPRPNGARSASPAVPGESVFADPERDGGADGVEARTRFSAVRAKGRARGAKTGTDDDAVGWVGVGGLGRAGIFEGDWVMIRAAATTDSMGGSTTSSPARLVRIFAWERLDELDSCEADDKLPHNPILLPPNLFRSLFPPGVPTLGRSSDIILSPTPFGARQPTLPLAKTITVARLATTEALDKRYERSWVRGVRNHFKRPALEHDEAKGLLVRRGDIFSVPIWPGVPLGEAEEADGSPSESESESDEDRFQIRSRPGARQMRNTPTALAFFQITSLSFDPLVPLEDDFSMSISSKARSGELGVWADVGEHGGTRLVLTGSEKAMVAERRSDQIWHGVVPSPLTASSKAASQLRDLLASCFASPGLTAIYQLSILIAGARGAGKTSLVRSLADELGFNVIHLKCYDIIGDTAQTLQGTLSTKVDKAKASAPSILLLHHIEALAKKSESTALGRPPAIVKVLEDAFSELKAAAAVTTWPCVIVGTTVDSDVVPGDVLSLFKQEIALSAPNENERRQIAENLLADSILAPDVTIAALAAQTAALHAGDIRSLILQAGDLSLRRAVSTTHRSAADVKLSGLCLTQADITSALNTARSAYADSIGAPKIPNVSWDDIGGLAAVKGEILETIQLPLDHPELFASGLKKRSGILLYGPPGTGKTLLAKAVATSCSLNFFSVKGPELLNMYIGESEANVRRIFQRARDASPCVIFMDELDSIAPKRGNQGDSGGVMDRIVSQLLAELDGMSTGSNGDVYVMGATNRPDLLDTALLRPGRFDRMVYLSPPSSHREQVDILRALTRKFDLDPQLDLEDVAERCEFNLTGADLYALASDAMLVAMTRVAERVDERIKDLQSRRSRIEERERSRLSVNGDATGGFRRCAHISSSPTLELESDHGDMPNGDEAISWKWPKPLTPQYYLSTMAAPDEIRVRVGMSDFEQALRRLRPSVSVQEMMHYEAVQGQFRAGQ